MPRADYRETTFTAGGVSHRVFQRGEGPAILVLHELPGLSDMTFDLADRLVARGFTTFLPLLFGDPGDFKLVRNSLRVCVSRELRIFQRRETSPIVDWLRALARQCKEECGGPGVGVIGMCLTGNFAISLFADDAVLVPVVCQPSLPLALFPGAARSLAMSDDDIATVKRRTDAGERMLGYRFAEDRLCPAARFERLREVFGEGFVGTEIPREGRSPFRAMRHAVLTLHFVDKAGHPTREALDTIMRFMDERLDPGESKAVAGEPAA